MDNGKPIREAATSTSRWSPATSITRRLGRALEREFPASRGRSASAGQIIPWNFPLLMLAWKIAPALAAGNTVVLKPAEFTPLTALALRRDLPRGRPAARRRQHRHRRRRDRRGARRASRRRQDRLHRLDRGRPHHPRRRRPASGKKLSLELGGKSPFIVFDDADLDSAVEGVVDAIWFNQGQVCCAGSRLLVQEGVAERLIAKLRARMETLRVGDPLDKAIDIGAIVAPVQLERISELVEQGEQEGADAVPADVALPAEGCFFRRRCSPTSSPPRRVAQVEIFGPVLVAMTFRTPDEAVALANNTPLRARGQRLDGERSHLSMAQRLQAGVVWVNATNLFDAPAVRRLQGERLRPRGRAAWARAVPEIRMSRLPVRKTYKLFIGGDFPRSESGRTYQAEGQNVARASRKDVRDAVRAARAAQRQVGGDDCLQPRPGALPRRRDDGGAQRRARGIVHAAPKEVARSIDRVVWYAGWCGQARPGARLARTRSPAVLQLHAPGADRRGRGDRAARAGPRGSRLAGRARDRQRQHGGGGRHRAAARWPRSRWPRCSRPPTCPAVSSTSSPAGATRWRRCSRPTWT